MVRDLAIETRVDRMTEKLVERVKEIERSIDSGTLSEKQKKDLMHELLELDRILWDILEKSRRGLIKLSRSNDTEGGGGGDDPVG